MHTVIIHAKVPQKRAHQLFLGGPGGATINDIRQKAGSFPGGIAVRGDFKTTN